MAFERDRQAEAIAAEWDVDVGLLEETDWEVETIDGNDGEVYGYLVRFDDETDPEILAQLGIAPGGFTRQLGINAFDEPEEEPDFVERGDELNEGQRSYNIDDDIFTPSQFRRLSRRRKVEAMVQWFHENYEDPAIRTPYESAEGGYQWIWGGPYDAREEIGSEFSDIAGEDLVEEAVDAVTRDGLFDWAPKERGDDYEQDAIEEPLPDISNWFSDKDDEEELPELPPGQAYLADESDRILTDERGNFIVVDRPVSIDILTREMLSKLDQLETALTTYQENLPPRNHNHPPELVEPDPISSQELRIVIEVVGDLRKETQKPRPDPQKFEEQASVFRAAARSILAWLGRKMDAAVDSAIKWGTPMLGVWLLAHPEKLYSALAMAAATASALAKLIGVG